MHCNTCGSDDPWNYFYPGLKTIYAATYFIIVMKFTWTTGLNVYDVWNHKKKVQSNYDGCTRTTILWNGWLVVSSALISNTVYHDVIVFVGIKATVTYSYTVYDAYKYASMPSDVTMCCLRTNYITKGRLAFVWNA